MNYSERTIQDYVKRTLGEPNERYGGPSKLAARKHATVLRKLLKASDERRPKQLKVTGFTRHRSSWSRRIVDDRNKTDGHCRPQSLNKATWTITTDLDSTQWNCQIQCLFESSQRYRSFLAKHVEFCFVRTQPSFRLYENTRFHGSARACETIGVYEVTQYGSTALLYHVPRSG
jgi:hypothetical protein